MRSGYPVAPASVRARVRLGSMGSILWFDDLEEADADVCIPAHAESTGDVLEFSRSSCDCAYREAGNGRESIFVLIRRLSLVRSCSADRNGSSIKGVEVILVPCSVTEEICCTCAVVGNGTLKSHGDLTNGLSFPVFFLADDDSWAVGVANTGVEVHDQGESAIGLCMGRCGNSKQQEA